ncbi:MAG TPA: hypothetical protein VFJ21_04835 [Mycobacteriales bacterium]|nr:hypothetical protein [Mycobacteriales bacterium]
MTAPDHDSPPAALPAGDAEPHLVLVYSSEPEVRDRVRTALGRRPARGLTLDYVEASTGEEVVAACERGGVELAILDGEAWPAGGMGICRQLKAELLVAPLVLIIVGRRDDAWLATWSDAEAVVAHPIDAVTLTEAVTDLLLGVTRQLSRPV